MLCYHFTSRQLLPRVEAEGITRCGVPWILPPPPANARMMTGLQWLTVDPEFDTQTWAEPAMYAEHLMRKTDWRIDVDIPNLAEFQLFDWRDFAAAHKLPVAEYFRTFRGYQHWRIFRGKIPRAWFASRMRNPSHYVLGDVLEYGATSL